MKKGTDAKMKRIASFEVNHDVLTPGIYTSRIDGDITTYDIRFKHPNGGDYLDPAVMHTIEHLFATYARNSVFSERIIYVGPMGCRTGFYLLTRELADESVIKLLQDTFAFIKDYSGEIPGNTAKECGNYLEHDLQGAKTEAAIFYKAIQSWKNEDMIYKK